MVQIHRGCPAHHAVVKALVIGGDPVHDGEDVHAPGQDGWSKSCQVHHGWTGLERLKVHVVVIVRGLEQVKNAVVGL